MMKQTGRMEAARGRQRPDRHEDRAAARAGGGRGARPGRRPARRRARRPPRPTSRPAGARPGPLPSPPPNPSPVPGRPPRRAAGSQCSAPGIFHPEKNGSNDAYNLPEVRSATHSKAARSSAWCAARSAPRRVSSRWAASRRSLMRARPEPGGTPRVAQQGAGAGGGAGAAAGGRFGGGAGRGMRRRSARSSRGTSTSWRRSRQRRRSRSRRGSTVAHHAARAAGSRRQHDRNAGSRATTSYSSGAPGAVADDPRAEGIPMPPPVRALRPPPGGRELPLLPDDVHGRASSERSRPASRFQH